MVKLNCDIYLRRKGYFTFSRTTTALVHFVINNPKTFLFKCKICCSISCEPMGGKTPFHFSLVQIRENNCNIYSIHISTIYIHGWVMAPWELRNKCKISKNSKCELTLLTTTYRWCLNPKGFLDVIYCTSYNFCYPLPLELTTFLPLYNIMQTEIVSLEFCSTFHL